MPTQTSPSTTNFVQDYAAKRAAQMERARKLREDRQHHLQQQLPQGGPPPFSNPGNSNVSHPNNSSGSSANRMSSHSPNAPASNPAVVTAAPNRRIINLVEDDFKRATKAGIITPDQARQLWAMLSDQIVHVESGTTPTVNSMESSATMPNDIEPIVSPASRGGQARGFRSSISMDSLRASIAQFKERQKRQQFGSKPQAARGAATADTSAQDAYEVATRVFAPTGANAVSGAVGAAIARPTRREFHAENSEPSIPHAYPQQAHPQRQLEDEEAGEWGAHHETPLQKRQRENKSKPAWNFDVDVGFSEAPPVVRDPSIPKSQFQQQQQAPKHPPAKRGVSDNGTLAPPQSRGAGNPVTASPHVSHIDEPSSFSKPVRNVLKKKVPTMPTSTMDGVVDIDNMVVGGSVSATIPTEGHINESLVPCGLCGRTFRASIVSRHEKACQQLQKKRRAFDVKGQRLDGIEGMKEIQSSSQPPKKRQLQQSQQQQQAVKLPKWKIQHEQFQAAMRVMKQVDTGETHAMGNYNAGPLMGGGKRMPPPAPMPEAYDDRVPCPHCGRKFAEVAAERHIPMCAKTIAKPKGIRPTRR